MLLHTWQTDYVTTNVGFLQYDRKKQLVTEVELGAETGTAVNIQSCAKFADWVNPNDRQAPN